MSAILLRNIWLKTGALALAIVTWWMVQQSLETTDTLLYQIKVKHAPNIVTKEIFPSTFSITVSGTREAVDASQKVQHVYTIDLTDVEKSQHLLLTIDEERIDLPGLTIDAISQKDISIDLDLLVQKELEVELHIAGEPAPGYVKAGEFISPSRIFLELPERVARKLSTVKTARTDISDLTSTLQDKVALVDPLDSSRRLNTLVDIRIVIRPEIIQRTFDDIPVHIMSLPDDTREVEISNEKISVTVHGRADIMETFDKANISVYLDITRQETGEYNQMPSVKPIEGIESIKPESVEYTIRTQGT